MIMRNILLVAVLVTPGAAQDAKAPRKPKESGQIVKPAPQKVRGLKYLPRMTERALVQAALRDLASGWVVVEDQELTLKPGQVVRFGNLRVLARPLTSPAGLPPAPWVDNTIVVSGTNTVAQIFPLGWGYR